MPSCKEIRQELVNCMLKSDCVLIKQHTVKGEISLTVFSIDNIVYNATNIFNGSIYY